MYRFQLRHARLAVCLLLSAIYWVGFANGRVRGQNGADDSMPANISPDQPIDRMASVEARLCDLETRNRQLQQQYDNLARKNASMFQQSKSAILGGESRNPDGKGVPGGLDLSLSALGWKDEPSGSEEENQAEDDDVRRQSGTSGAGIRIGGGDRSMPPSRSPFGQRSQDIFRRRETSSGQADPRRQSGTSGGAGVRLGPNLGEEMGEYVERRGPYVAGMRPLQISASAFFREGLQIRSSDELFTLEFHNLTQFDVRTFSQTGDALHDNFVIPRQRWYFQGDVTPYATYYTVINRGYGSLDVLDSWVDFNFAPKYKGELQFRVGRMKTPYTYEYFKISESDLIAPERSLFLGNFAPNREVGVMAHGQIFDSIVEYAVGVFNGPRRSFQDFNNNKDGFAFLNLKPFINTDIGCLKNLNLGASVNGGNERNPAQPSALTTANDQSPPSSPAVVNVSPTFMIFNPKTFENGPRMLWSGDAAYYYKSFTFLAGYQGGFQNYSLEGAGTLPSTAAFEGFASGAFVGVGSSKSTRVPLEGWSVAATYFLTGEQVSRRVYLTEPIRPFGYYNGKLNPGAIELFGRFSDLQIGSEIFSGGFADPKLWSNRANAIDVGVNWYLNHYVRLYFDWQHSMFGSPVFLSDTKSVKHENLYWFRTQVFF